MPGKLRTPSHAVVVAYLSLFVALGGSSYAAVKITGKNVTNNSLTGRDIKNLGTADVKNRSLLSKDFKAGQLPAGAQGPAGGRGATGATGTVDTSNFYSKSASDARFLGVDATADDSDELGGVAASSYLTQANGGAGASQGTADLTILTLPGFGELHGECLNPAQARVSWKNTSTQDERLFVDDGGATPDFFDPVANNSSAGEVTGGVGGAEHVVYMVRPINGIVWIDVFATATGASCLFYAKAYGP